MEKRKAIYETGKPGRGHSRVRLRDHLALWVVLSSHLRASSASMAASSVWLTSKPEFLCTMGGVPAASSRVICLLCSSFAKMM